MLAECELLDNDIDAARDRLQTYVDAYGSETDEDDRISVLTWLAWAHLERGEVAHAEQVVLDVRARAAASHYALLLMDALRVEAQVRIAQGRWLEAETTLDESLTRIRAMPYPYAEAKALWVYGQLEVARGNQIAAHERFTAALGMCERLGERMYAERIDRDLAALSVRKN